jgi:hypothetical protein
MPPFDLNLPNTMTPKPIFRALALCATLGVFPFGSLAHAAPASKPASAAARMYVHEAKQGDTLLGLAARYLIRPGDWKTLEKLNAIADPRRIPVGTQVKIPVELMRTEFTPATVLRATGKAELGSAGLAPNTVLKEGDAIRTGDDGFVTLKLADGSTMTLQPRSLLKVKTTRQLVNTGGVADTQMRLENGRLETRVAKQRSLAARYEIDTPTSNMGVRGTIFRVSTDGAAKSQSEVTEGLVAAPSLDPKFPGAVDVAAGFGTIVEAGKAPSAPVQLLAPPTLKQTEATSEVADVQVAFGPVSGAVSYRGQVAIDGTFSQLVADVTSRTNDIAFKDLPDGELHVRVRGVDAQGLEGRDAQGTRTIKARPFAPALLQPENGSRLAAAPAALRWKPAADATAYRVQLADASGTGFTVPLLDKPALADAELKVGRALNPGRWTWRVASVDGQGKQGPWSQAGTFDVQPPLMKFTPYPDKTGRVIGIGDEKQKVQVQASRDSRFATIVADRVVDGQIDLSDLPVNAYYVRARPAAVDGAGGEWSPAWRLEEYPGGWQLINLAGNPR